MTPISSGIPQASQENISLVANPSQEAVSVVALRALKRAREEEESVVSMDTDIEDIPISVHKRPRFPLDRIITEEGGPLSLFPLSFFMVNPEERMGDLYANALRNLLVQFDNPLLFPPETPAPSSLPSFSNPTQYVLKPRKVMGLPNFWANYYAFQAAYSSTSDQIAFVLPQQGGYQTWIQNLKSGKTISLLPWEHLHGENRPISLLFTPKGEGLIISRRDGEIEVWSLGKDKGHLEWAIHPAKEAKIERALQVGFSSLMALATVLDQKILAGDHVGTLYQIDQATKRVEKTVSFSSMGRILKIAVSPTGRYVALTSAKGEVAILNSETLETIQRVQPSTESIRAAAFAPDGSNWIAVGAGTGDPHVYIYRFLGSQASDHPVLKILVRSQVTNILWNERNCLYTTQWDGIRAIPLDLDSAGFMIHGPIIHTSTGAERVLFADIRSTEQGNELLYTQRERLLFSSLPTNQPKPASDSLWRSIIR